MKLLRLVHALLLRGWGGRIFRRSHEWPPTHLTPGMLPKIDVEAISAIRGQRRTNLESNPSLLKLNASFSKFTKERA